MFRIHSAGGCTYFASDFYTTDSTIVVTGLRQPPSDPASGRCGETPDIPFELNFKDVERIERIEEGVGFPIVIVLVTAAFVALAIATGLPWGG